MTVRLIYVGGLIYGELQRQLFQAGARYVANLTEGLTSVTQYTFPDTFVASVTRSTF